MPIYEYRCKKCGHTFEALVMGREKVVCDKCGGKGLEKLVSTFSAPGREDVMPECLGATPSCSRSRCDSGVCPAMR